MRIPKNQEERWAFFEDIASKCNASRGERRRNYQSLRNYYMYGTDGSASEPAKYNKIYPHIDQLTSFLYSQETTRFTTSLGVSVSDMEYAKIGPINRGLNDEWNNSNTDIIFGNALTWSLVYGSVFIKPRWKVNGIEPFIVDPHNFGVLREDSPMIASQEAMTHSYYITEHQLEDELESANHPRKAQIMANIVKGPKANTSQVSPLDRIITSASSPNVIGNVDFNLTLTSRYNPKVAEDLIEMVELYVYDDELSDFRVITMADPYVLIYDRPLEQMFLKNEPPFVQICPNPSYDYFYGFSEVERLISVQELLNQRWKDVMHLLGKQARPPKSFSGFQGITDEIAFAFDTPNASVQSEMPGAKVDVMSPQIPNDLWKDIDYLNMMFEDTSGINNVMQGKGESGVRSSGHASQLARLGSSRVKKRAMIVEDSLEKLATMYLQIKQRYDKRRYKEEPIKGEGAEFIANQFTDDYVVKVDGHSNSPIFVEDQTQIAFELFKVGAITKERLIELTNVPMKPQLLQDLVNKIEPAEAEAHKQEHDLKVAEINAKGRKHA
jgi:hypothetical protein